MGEFVALKKNRDFLKVYKRGKFFVGKFMVLYVLPNRQGITRLGITVSKKVGKSVTRNRQKRLMKENFRVFKTLIKEGYDLVFVARSSEKLADFWEIKKEMKFLLRKLGIIERAEG